MITSCLFAQEINQHLEIDYEMVMEIDPEFVVSQIPYEYRKQFGELIREELKEGIITEYKLKTDGKISIYKLQEKINNSQTVSGTLINQIMEADKLPIYKLLEEKLFLKEYEFNQKKYLVRDSLKSFNWNISKETEEIEGYQTFKSEGTISDSIKVIAWYSPRVPYKDGPDEFWGLPGMILKIQYEAGNNLHTITAKNITVKENKLIIKLPKNKDFFTLEEYESIIKSFFEKRKEMNYGGVDKN